MRARAATGVLVVAVALGGCSAPSTERSERSEPSNPAQALWAARTDFVGDNSRVAALAGQAGFRQMGTYVLSLQTQQAPYAITVTFDHLDKPFETADLSSQATLMLGLVTNLDKVSVTSADHSFSLTASDASRALGFDVKQLGRDEGTLAEYLRVARD